MFNERIFMCPQIQDHLWRYFNRSYGDTGRLNCYCKNQLFSSDPTAVVRLRFFNPESGAEEAWCTSWLNSYLQFEALMYTTTAVVVGVNLLFRKLLKPVVKMEHSW